MAADRPSPPPDQLVGSSCRLAPGRTSSAEHAGCGPDSPPDHLGGTAARSPAGIIADARPGTRSEPSGCARGTGRPLLRRPDRGPARRRHLRSAATIGRTPPASCSSARERALSFRHCGPRLRWRPPERRPANGRPTVACVTSAFCSTNVSGQRGSATPRTLRGLTSNCIRSYRLPLGARFTRRSSECQGRRSGEISLEKPGNSRSTATSQSSMRISSTQSRRGDRKQHPPLLQPSLRGRRRPAIELWRQRR